MEKLTLVDCLKLFNRKERYWLIRNALGNGKELNLPVDSDFIKKIESKLQQQGIEMPNPGNIWWGMDYHFDWLLGAIKLYETANNGTDVTKEVFRCPGNSGMEITGTQEDIDFILAFDETIILIEAKCQASWDKKQLIKKRDRVKIVKDLAQEKLKIEFLLMSPKEPDDSPVKHIEMLIPPDKIVPHNISKQWEETKRFLKPTRCDESGTSDKDEKCWKIEAINKPNLNSDARTATQSVLTQPY